MGVERITVGLDGSEPARQALDWAGALARQTGAVVIATHVVGLLVDTPAGPVPSGSQLHRLRMLLEGEWTEGLRKAGVVYRCRLEEDSPVSGLLRAAAEDDTDLIVVGSRGSGGFSPPP